MSEKYFPVFINLEGKKALMVGGGNIAGRRVKGLLAFGAEVTVVAPTVSDQIRVLASQYDTLRIEERTFAPGEIEGYDVALAATDDPAVDDAVYSESREKHIPVSVASDQSKCDFYFPGLIETEDVVIGVCSGGKNHSKVREVCAKIREWFVQE